MSVFHIVFGKEILMNENLQLFKANEVLQYKFITVPKELFVNPKYCHLSSDSKLLYGFILDRFHLSIQNNWKDENNNIYLILTRKDIQKLFHLSDKTVTKAFKELSNCNLIYEKKQGRNKPNLIYPCKIDFEWSRKNYDSGLVKSTTLESENLRPNNTNNKNTNGVKSKRTSNFEQRSYEDFDFNTLLANYKEFI